MSNKDISLAEPVESEPVKGSKRPYMKPALTVFGQMAGMTLGVSMQIGESANPAAYGAVTVPMMMM